MIVCCRGVCLRCRVLSGNAFEVLKMSVVTLSGSAAVGRRSKAKGECVHVVRRYDTQSAAGECDTYVVRMLLRTYDSTTSVVAAVWTAARKRFRAVL